jgi:hypothetical protein
MGPLKASIRTLSVVALALALTSLLLAGTLAGSASGEAHAPAAPHKKKRPKPKQRPLYWGAWIGDQITGTPAPWDMNAVTQFQNLVGKGLSLVEFSSPFADCGRTPCSFTHFPGTEMSLIRNYGAIPFYSWGSQSTPAESVNQPDFQLSDINSGSYDSYIQSFAEEARSWGQPFFLRFNWEPNGNWFVWDEGVNGNLPGEFVSAWRRVHDIFTAVGATNATWVWCPYADAAHRFGPLASFFPGKKYVDWTCLDGYNWSKAPVNPHPWTSFDKIFYSSYQTIVKRLAPEKPMILGEMASNGIGGGKAKWIRDMFSMLRTKYQRVRGIIWFNQYAQGITWPIETSAATVKAFSDGVRGGPYRPNIFAGLAKSPIAPPR